MPCLIPAQAVRPGSRQALRQLEKPRHASEAQVLSVQKQQGPGDDRARNPLRSRRHRNLHRQVVSPLLGRLLPFLRVVCGATAVWFFLHAPYGGRVHIACTLLLYLEQFLDEVAIHKRPNRFTPKYHVFTLLFVEVCCCCCLHALRRRLRRHTLTLLYFMFLQRDDIDGEHGQPSTGSASLVAAIRVHPRHRRPFHFGVYPPVQAGMHATSDACECRLLPAIETTALPNLRPRGLTLPLSASQQRSTSVPIPRFFWSLASNIQLCSTSPPVWTANGYRTVQVYDLCAILGNGVRCIPLMYAPWMHFVYS